VVAILICLLLCFGTANAVEGAATAEGTDNIPGSVVAEILFAAKVSLSLPSPYLSLHICALTMLSHRALYLCSLTVLSQRALSTCSLLSSLRCPLLALLSSVSSPVSGLRTVPSLCSH
jgi:hypothetical protein